MKHDLMRLGLPVAPCLGLFAGRIAIPPAILRSALTVAKFLGLFRVARYMTRDGLRIICYHGIAVAEEYKYRSRLFVRIELFRRRIEYLRHKCYPILPLGESLEALDQGRLPACATVITMDDGWEGVYSVALPIIKELAIPVTLYVPTFYIQHPMPVFTVTLSYLFWRTKAHRAELPRDLGSFVLDSDAERAEAVAQELGATLPAADRLKFLKEMAEALDVSFADIETQHLFRVVDEQQLRELADAGVDIQLHSHSHQWSVDDSRTTVEAEIADNRRFLEKVVSHPLEHFCYPSGIHGPHQGGWLAVLGVKSATTIEPGLNYPNTPRFALRRLMDGHPVSDIEFEAEMTGFMEIVRALRERRFFRMLRRRVRSYRDHDGSGVRHGKKDRTTCDFSPNR
jgi:peptidoglycan/xylan/chitin deacetylase (PgdA/CDA1 family)